MIGRSASINYKACVSCKYRITYLPFHIGVVIEYNIPLFHPSPLCLLPPLIGPIIASSGALHDQIDVKEYGRSRRSQSIGGQLLVNAEMRRFRLGSCGCMFRSVKEQPAEQNKMKKMSVS